MTTHAVTTHVRHGASEIISYAHRAVIITCAHRAGVSLEGLNLSKISEVGEGEGEDTLVSPLQLLVG